MDATTFNAKDYPKVDRDPFYFAARATIGAPAISLVVITDRLKQF